MSDVHGRIAVSLCATALAASWGCGDERPAVESSMAEATVRGTVRIKGKLATRGTVTFDPSNYLRKDAAARSARIAKDGTYSVTTLVGENTVMVQSPDLGRNSRLAYNEQTFVVKDGTNTFDIDLSPGRR
jgi:hypothetical protein